MRVVITSNRRFIRTPDGRIWSKSGDDYEFWKRYLTSFEEVLVIGRVKNEKIPINEYRKVNGPGISVLGLPHYVGPQELLLNIFPILICEKKGIKQEDAFILRIPGHINIGLDWILTARKHPYGAEVVGGIGSPLEGADTISIGKKLFKNISDLQLRRLCRRANAISYVTGSAIQAKFPPNRNAFITNYSSIELPQEAFSEKATGAINSIFRIISVGSMEMRYKRFDILIKAFKCCIDNGCDMKLTIVGGGRYKGYYEKMAYQLGDKCEFLGELPGSEYVRKELVKANLFVLPSAYEGLPRVLIEAMAVGLPCISTDVGGVSELLEEEELIPKNDVQAMAREIQAQYLHKNNFSRISKRNVLKAQEYSENILRPRRDALYEYVREITMDHIRNRKYIFGNIG